MPAEKLPAGRTCRSNCRTSRTVMKAAGYNVVYKGKWHCSKPETPEDAKPSDLEKYGFTAGTRRTPAPTRASPRRAAASPTTTAASSNSEGTGGRRRGPPVPRLRRGQGTAVLPGDLTGQPARRPLLPEQDLREAGYDDSWLEGDIELPQTNEEDLSTKPTVQEEFLKIFNLTGKPETQSRKAGLPELLRQPDALLRQLPGQRPRQARRERALRRHADRPHRRPRRDGPHPRRHAAEELQLLRGGDAGPARLLEPEAVPAAGRNRRARLPRRLPADAGEPGGGAEERPRQLAGRRLLQARPQPEAARRSRTTSSSPTTTSSPARRSRPTRNRRTTSSASAKAAGSWPSTTTSPARCANASRRSGRCTT